jgi:anaerobic selenocysteine-containing dehydrogenase
MGEIRQSACPLNCWDSCGFHIEVEDGKVRKVDGDPTHPITKGKICGRGRALETRTNSAKRLTVPLKKINGAFEEISWEKALEEISQNLINVKERYGSEAVLHSHDYANNGLLKNLDKRFFNAFGGVTELYGSICWGSGIEAQVWDFGASHSHAPEDILHSKNIVIWGRNVARTNMHLFSYLQEAKKKGATITVIDPIHNATAKLAHHYVSVKPGMDGLLAIAIMKELLEKDVYDKEFIEKYTHGFPDLCKLLDSLTMEEILDKTEVSRDIISLLASLYESGPTSTYLGLGMQRYQNGGNTIRLIDALVALSGNVGINGGGSHFGNTQVGESFNIKELSRQDLKETNRKFSMMTQAKEMMEADEPPIKTVIVTCGNPLTQVPDTNSVHKAFSNVETMIVFEQFMTDTALLADYILPVTTVFEETDIYFSSMYHGYMNYSEKAVEPPGQAKPDLWIWTELSKRLGFFDLFNYTVDEFLEMGLSSLTEKGITLEKLKEKHHILLPIKAVPWEDRRFKTPSGKYEFTSLKASEAGYSGLLSASLPGEVKKEKGKESSRHPYTLLSIHPLRSNHSQHYHVLKGMDKATIDISPDIALERELKNGDRIRVYNDRGVLEGEVKILKEAHPRTVNIDEGRWRTMGETVNVLTSSALSDNGLGSSLYDCVVNIEKL